MRKARDELRKEIEKLKKELHHQKKQKEKYKKRLQRVSKSQDSPRSKVGHLLKNCTVNNRVRKTLLHHEVLIANIRRTYQNASNEKNKKSIAQVVVGKIVKKYKMQGWSEKVLGFSKKRWTLQNVDLGNCARCSRNRYADKLIKSKVKTFFTRDDVSRMTTGKKQTITRKKIKMQKRFLVDTMLNLHLKFLAENNTSNISYSAFCRLRPFWVVHPSLADRDSCQCKLHENLGFLAEKLH